MADQWYYEHETIKSGPYSAEQLRELAAAGRIILSDTIWKEGVVRGQSASRVKNLFSAAASAARQESPPSATSDVRAEEQQPAAAPVAPQAATPDAPAQAAKKPERKIRAVAGRGIVITNQDGVNVWFKKKCSVCGVEDSQRGRTMIKRGANRMSFLCHKCRKMREAEFQGIM